MCTLSARSVLRPLSRLPSCLVSILLILSPKSQYQNPLVYIQNKPTSFSLNFCYLYISICLLFNNHQPSLILFLLLLLLRLLLLPGSFPTLSSGSSPAYAASSALNLSPNALLPLPASRTRRSFKGWGGGGVVGVAEIGEEASLWELGGEGGCRYGDQETRPGRCQDQEVAGGARRCTALGGDGCFACRRAPEVGGSDFDRAR
ncbi:hypothetical protein CK203_106274 [Vitis vinifera]|uniref:Uncharacterized protein n=1 Tax=Vitis vinifera TaxID=29760 RepID=A0A438BQ21_VITVI|nr:hypothetical protein CK203_106274 [Vitis vinifera]